MPFEQKFSPPEEKGKEVRGKEGCFIRKFLEGDVGEI